MSPLTKITHIMPMSGYGFGFRDRFVRWTRSREQATLPAVPRPGLPARHATTIISEEPRMPMQGAIAHADACRHPVRETVRKGRLARFSRRHSPESRTDWDAMPPPSGSPQSPWVAQTR
jgi:hypothetical protein